MDIFAADRAAEFRRYYEPDPKRKLLGYGTYVIQDYVKAVKPGHPDLEDFNSEKQALLCFVNQLTIFKSIMNRVDSILNDIEVSLYSALEDSEIEVAKKLAKVNLRAAGALLGVIIEGHLQKVATSHGVVMGERNPTIADLNDPLKAASVIDLSTYPRGGESPTSQICATFAATRRTANPQPAT